MMRLNWLALLVTTGNTAALAPAMSPTRHLATSHGAARHAAPVAAVDNMYHRAKDVLATEGSVSTQDIVNVLGRWNSYTDWESVGDLKQMDGLFDKKGAEINKAPAQQTSTLLGPKKGNGDWVKKTPQRRGWCLRNGLVQACSVGSLTKDRIG